VRKRGGLAAYTNPQVKQESNDATGIEPIKIAESPYMEFPHNNVRIKRPSMTRQRLDFENI
jgi:hypothetical protein